MTDDKEGVREENNKLRDEEWSALWELKRQTWSGRNECARGIKHGVIQRVGWKLVPAEHCQHRLDNITLRNEMLFQCNWFRARPPCPFRVKARQQEDGNWKIDAICPFHSMHPLDEVAELERPTLKMGNPGLSAMPIGSSSNSKRNQSNSPSAVDPVTGLYKDYSAASSGKGSVKRRRRSSTPPSMPFPYDEKLKKEHTQDPTASKLPKLGQRFKTVEAFERVCDRGTPIDSNWILCDATHEQGAVEKRCKHTRGIDCTGDNFRVRCEQQDDGVWVVVRAIYLHDVGISAVFQDSLDEMQEHGARTRRAAAHASCSNSALSRNASQLQQSKSKRPSVSKRPSYSSKPTSTASSQTNSLAGSEDAATPPLSVQPYKPRGSSSDIFSNANGSRPDVSISPRRELQPRPSRLASVSPESRRHLSRRSSVAIDCADSRRIASSVTSHESTDGPPSLRSSEGYDSPPPVKHSANSKLVQAKVQDTSNDEMMSYDEDEFKPTTSKPWQRVTDFLNKLSPPTDNDDGLGDLVGRACYEVGWVMEQSFWIFMAQPELFATKCEEKLAATLSEWEMSLLKESMVSWLQAKKAEML